MVQGPPELAKKLGLAYPGVRRRRRDHAEFVEAAETSPRRSTAARPGWSRSAARGSTSARSACPRDKRQAPPLSEDHAEQPVRRLQGPRRADAQADRRGFRRRPEVGRGPRELSQGHLHPRRRAGERHLRRRRDLQDVPSEHVQQVGLDQARPGLRRPDHGPQAQPRGRRRLRPLPHHGVRVQGRVRRRPRPRPTSRATSARTATAPAPPTPPRPTTSPSARSSPARSRRTRRRSGPLPQLPRRGQRPPRLRLPRHVGEGHALEARRLQGPEGPQGRRAPKKP